MALATPKSSPPPPPEVPKSEERLENGRVIAEKYRIDRVLGEGGMGVVYAATNVLTQKRVAIKWLLPEFARDENAVARFLREAQAAGSIHHPNVINVFDVGRENGTPFLVMELLHGEPMSNVLEGGALSPSSAAELMMPALRGIAAAHALGIVHRDLKPENIFLCRGKNGRVVDAKILDFGISRAVDADAQSLSLTRSGAIVGTPHYLSPEQIRGRKDIDARVDVYAIGVILYEALAGCLPFKARSFPALAVEIATTTPRPPTVHNPQIPVSLEHIVMRAMARRTDDRYPNIESLALELEPFAGGARFTDAETRMAIELERAGNTTGPLRAVVDEEKKVAPPVMSRAPIDRALESAPTIADFSSDSLRLPQYPWMSRRVLWSAAAALAVLFVGSIVYLAASDPGTPTRAAVPPPRTRPAPEPVAAPVAPIPAAPIVQQQVPIAPQPVVQAPVRESAPPRRRARRESLTASPVESPAPAPAPVRRRSPRIRSGRLSVDEF